MLHGKVSQSGIRYRFVFAVEDACSNRAETPKEKCLHLCVVDRTIVGRPQECILRAVIPEPYV